MDKDKVLLVLHGKQAGNEEVRAASRHSARPGGSWRCG